MITSDTRTIAGLAMVSNAVAFNANMTADIVFDSTKIIVAATAAIVNLVNNNFVSSNITKEVTEPVSSYVANIEISLQELVTLIKESVTASERINTFIRSMDRSPQSILTSLKNVLNQAKELVAIAEAVVHPAKICRNRAERILLLCQGLGDSTKTDNLTISSLENTRDDTTLIRIPKMFALFPTPGLGWRFIKLIIKISTVLHLKRITALITTIIL